MTNVPVAKLRLPRPALLRCRRCPSTCRARSAGLAAAPRPYV